MIFDSGNQTKKVVERKAQADVAGEGGDTRKGRDLSSILRSQVAVRSGGNEKSVGGSQEEKELGPNRKNKNG